MSVIRPYQRASVLTAAASISLTTLAAVKEEIGISDTTDDGWLVKTIRRTSAAIAKHCNRTFGNERVQEDGRIYGGIIPLLHFPVRSVESVVINGEPLEDYQLESGAGTMLFDDEDWIRYTVIHQAGWNLPDDANRDLPEDVELAAILVMKDAWYSRNRDPALRQEVVPGVGENQFWVGSSLLPDETVSLLAPYRVYS